jgi:hypothetical protein
LLLSNKFVFVKITLYDFVLILIIFFQNENLSQILKEVKEGKSVKFLTKTNKNKNSNKVIEHSKSERLKVCNIEP